MTTSSLNLTFLASCPGPLLTPAVTLSSRYFVTTGLAVKVDSEGVMEKFSFLCGASIQSCRR